MEPENENSKRYYKFLLYFDHTSKNIFVYDPNVNRYTLNFANKFSFVILAIIWTLIILTFIFKYESLTHNQSGQRMDTHPKIH